MDKMIISAEYPNYFDGITESPIEADFAYMLCKILKPGIQFQSQIGFSTRLGNFRGDFMIQDEVKKVLIELDGKEFHKESNDNWRDSFILGENHIDVIIRFQGKDIVYNLNECCYILMEKFPDFFSERAKLNFNNLIDSKNLIEIRSKLKFNEFKFMDQYDFTLNYIDANDIEVCYSLQMHYKSKEKGYWMKYYDYAVNHSIFNIKLLNQKHFL